MRAPVIVWFRRDLRLADNPALAKAAATGAPMIPLYVHDDRLEGRPMGAASKWRLEKSLRALSADLEWRGASLVLRSGDAEAVLRALVAETGATALFMNRLFEPAAWERDGELAHGLEAEGITCRGFNASLLSRPGVVLNGQGRPYRIFTPFLKALLNMAEAPRPISAPPRLNGLPGVGGERLDDWRLHPRAPDWSTGFDRAAGEAAAHAALAAFVNGPLQDYAAGRDHPGQSGTSRLSAHLHFGEISPWRVAGAVREAAADGRAATVDAEKAVSELVWRDFSAHLLHHFPFMGEHSLRPEFERMTWRDAPDDFTAWKHGLTGYPIVDAGMRELWTTGWMHNRVRMIAASFLVKHLLIDWRQGEGWFHDTLVDFDQASNVQNWQWIAGCGADASPWFRIFNPVTQGEKFDRDGAYVRRWVPELAALPDGHIHAPWRAPADVLVRSRVQPGRDYPLPIVEHDFARQRALDAFARIRTGEDD